MESFYAAHKNDNQVSAVRVPQFMLSLLRGISPETEALIGDTKDLRYIKFPSTTADKTDFLNTQMNIIAGSKFIEIYRKNDDLKRSVIAVRERKNVVKEILIYNNNAQQATFLYFNGNFDPIKVREMAQNAKFDELTNGLIQQFNIQSSAIRND
ncbi:DUF4252 domain-containing protein [Cellulophaga baltica]|uniref:DUF4252 domain-containing protein n=1 Tax=Cellulophaga baltica TaxID=76594 RepID=UPI00217508D5|nr:DUF4252 domain-containing protein [Cellulophaga baltica]